MTNQNTTNPDQIYTTYIRTTPEKLWAALTNPEFTRQYWFGNTHVSDFKKGSAWQHVGTESKNVFVQGKVLESNPPKSLALSWAEPAAPKNESRVDFVIEPIEEGMVKLTVTHSGFEKDSEMARKVGGGWPLVLSSLKSFLETGNGFTTKPTPCSSSAA